MIEDGATLREAIAERIATETEKQQQLPLEERSDPVPFDLEPLGGEATTPGDDREETDDPAAEGTAGEPAECSGECDLDGSGLADLNCPVHGSDAPDEAKVETPPGDMDPSGLDGVF